MEVALEDVPQHNEDQPIAAALPITREISVNRAFGQHQATHRTNPGCGAALVDVLVEHHGGSARIGDVSSCPVSVALQMSAFAMLAARAWSGVRLRTPKICVSRHKLSRWILLQPHKGAPTTRSGAVQSSSAKTGQVSSNYCPWPLGAPFLGWSSGNDE
jgi:hypothetical protein